MEVPIDCPVPIKKDIARKLQSNGSLRRIEKKIQLAMMVAVEEIRDDPQKPGALERHHFNNASPHELRGLQLVYDYLSDRGLAYTLGALTEESCVPRGSAGRTSLFELVRTIRSRRPNAEYLLEEEEENPEVPPQRDLLSRSSGTARGSSTKSVLRRGASPAGRGSLFDDVFDD
jgi:hypothetical protein